MYANFHFSRKSGSLGMYMIKIFGGGGEGVVDGDGGSSENA